MPFSEAIRLNGLSYQDCEEVYLSESTDDLLSLSCTASSKPSSRLSWSADPATPALVVNQTIVAECKTAANSIVTCERNATIVTKNLKEVVQVTCVTHYDDRRTVMTSKRACVVLVPHGKCWLITHMSFLNVSIFNCVVQFTVFKMFVTMFSPFGQMLTVRYAPSAISFHISETVSDLHFKFGIYCT